MVCRQFSVALISYLNPIACTLVLILTEAALPYYTIGLLLSLFPLFILFTPWQHDVLYRAYFIGAVSSAGVIVAQYSVHTQLGIYLVALSFFHISEYLLTAVYKEDKLSLDSFLLNHSTAYHAALAAGLVEYVIEYVNLYDTKFVTIVSIIGACLMTGGFIFRKLAMMTAAENFDHIVQSEKAQNHRLVKNGVYSLSRHPSYAGWFYWSIGTQIFLCNPVCAVAYAYVSWKFFDERIEEEECYLLRFFGNEYQDYKRNVGVGIPGITGYQITPEHEAFLREVKQK